MLNNKYFEEELSTDGGQVVATKSEPKLFKLSIDPKKYTEKPPKEPLQGEKYPESLYISKRLAKSENQKSLNFKEFCQEIKSGSAWSCANDGSGNRAKINFESSQVIGADFDNEIDKVKLSKTDPEYLSLADCLKKFQESGIIVNGWYYTFSNTDECEKYRIVLLLDNPINSIEMFEKLTSGLIRLFPQIDAKCKDATRIFYGSDNFTILTEEPNNYETILAACPPEKEVKSEQKHSLQLLKKNQSDDIQKVVEAIPYFYNNITNMDDWSKIGFSLASIGEAARDVFIDICTNQSNYPDDTSESLNKDFDSFLKNYNGNVKIGTFFHYAKKFGCKIKSHSSANGINEIMMNSDRESSVRKRIRHMDSTENLLNEKCVYFDKLKKKFFIRKDGKSSEEITDMTLNSLWKEAITQEIDISFYDFKKILNSDSTPTVDPLDTYFKKLEKWDGLDNIKKLASTITLKNPDELEHFVIMLKKWLVGCIAGALTDKVNGLCLIFLGAQGLGKSTWFRHLTPPELSEYYTEHNPSDDKDSLMIVCQNFIVNIDELGSFVKSDITFLKRLITQTIHDIRLPYGTISTKIKRQSSFCGSGNQDSFLSDLSGNRRFLVFDVQAINLILLIAINQRQIWAEAYHLYLNEFQYWLNETETALINEKNELFMNTSFEEEMISKTFCVPGANDTPIYLTTSEISLMLELSSNQASLNRINDVLKKHKFQRKQIRTDGNKNPQRKWLLKKN